VADADVILNVRKVFESTFAVVDVSASGDTAIVAGVAGLKIVVYSIFLVASNTVTVTWKTGTTTILGGAGLAINGGYHVESDFGICQTVDGDSLVLTLSDAVQVGGSITYATSPLT